MSFCQVQSVRFLDSFYFSSNCPAQSLNSLPFTPGSPVYSPQSRPPPRFHRAAYISLFFYFLHFTLIQSWNGFARNFPLTNRSRADKIRAVKRSTRFVARFFALRRGVRLFPLIYKRFCASCRDARRPLPNACDGRRAALRFFRFYLISRLLCNDAIFSKTPV